MAETTSDTDTTAAAKRSTGARRSTGGTRRAKTAGSRKSAGGSTAAKARRSSRRSGPADLIAGYAERAVLIPVGAALIARDRLIDDVGGVISDYSSPAKAQAQLRRFERRGESARSGLTREARKTRSGLEREARRTRTRLEHTGRTLRENVPLPKRIQDRLAA